MVAYDISVIPALRAKAVSAKADSPELFAEFVKILDGALDNVSKINAPQIRDKAYADMSALFADVGMENKAIELARKVSEARLFEGTFAKIASTAGNSENYMDAIALASRMPDGRRKNDFLSDLAAGVARRGYFEAAFSIAETIKDPAARDYSHARIAAAAFGKNPRLSRGRRRKFRSPIRRFSKNFADLRAPCKIEIRPRRKSGALPRRGSRGFRISRRLR